MLILRKYLIASLIVSGACLLWSLNVSASDIKVNRIAGQDRFETCEKISNAGWTESNYAILVNSSMYADAVVASPLADQFKAPILLVQQDNIPDIIKNELIRLNTKKVFILGGKSLVSENVEKQLKDMGISIEERIAGQDRYETASKVASHIDNFSNSFYVVDGEDWRDALAISPLAVNLHCPIIFTNETCVPDVVKDNIDNAVHNYNIIGEKDNYNFLHNAENNLGGNKVEILGDDKEDTNAKIYDFFKDKVKLNKVYLASSKDFADGLCVSPLAGSNENAVFFVNEDNMNELIDFFAANRGKINEIDVIGGEGAVADADLKNLLKLNSTADISSATNNDSSTNSDNTNSNNANNNTDNNTDNNSNKDLSNSVKEASITPIMGQSLVSVEQCESFLREKNPNAPYLASIYKKYCDMYGIKLECAWVQMCLETNFLRYSSTSITTLNMKNYAGLGALDNNGRGQALTFDTEDEGVKCHIQHLYAYCSTGALPDGQTLIDPRFKYVERGCAPNIEDLGNGKWATDKEYASKLLNLLKQLKNN